MNWPCLDVSPMWYTTRNAEPKIIYDEDGQQKKVEKPRAKQE